MRDQARIMNMIQSGALNSFKEGQRQTIEDPQRKRMADSCVPANGGAQKRRRVGFPAGSVPLGKSWWRYGEIQKDIIQQTLAKQNTAGGTKTDGSQVSSVRTESALYFNTPGAASRIVSTDSLSQPAQRMPQGANGGISSFIQSLQAKSNATLQTIQQPSALGNAQFPAQLLGQQCVHGIPGTFFRQESAYHDTATSSVADEEDHDDDCSEDSSGLKFRAYQAENWTEKFEELIEFRNHFGHCLVPNAFPENPALAQWVKRQRYQYKLKTEGKRSTMSDERVTALEEIGFVWDSHGAIWDERLHDLLDYKQANGHCNVPSRYSQNRQLAVWVKRQRRQYKFYCDGQPSSMTEQRIARLNAIGFEWDLRQKK